MPHYFKKIALLNVAHLVAAVVPAMAQSSPNEDSEIRHIQTINANIRSVLKRAGQMKGMDEQGNSKQDAAFCFIVGSKPEKNAIAFIPEVACDKKKHAFFFSVARGELIEKDGPVWQRLRQSCAANARNRKNGALAVARCVEDGINLMQLGQEQLTQKTK
jgi:hypothetical protein